MGLSQTSSLAEAGQHVRDCRTSRQSFRRIRITRRTHRRRCGRPRSPRRRGESRSFLLPWAQIVARTKLEDGAEAVQVARAGEGNGLLGDVLRIKARNSGRMRRLAARALDGGQGVRNGIVPISGDPGAPGEGPSCAGAAKFVKAAASSAVEGSECQLVRVSHFTMGITPDVPILSVSPTP
jgi:hypothetical protein